MRILAIDTSTGACSAAVWNHGNICERLKEMSRGHAEALLPFVLAAMDDAATRFDELDLIAVTTGPGAFTGVRIGLAAARGMALAAGVPCLGVTSLEAIAAAVGPEDAAEGPLLVVIDSKRGDVYAQVFVVGAPAALPFLADARSIARHLPEGRVLVAGDATAAVLPVLNEIGISVRAAAVPGYPTAACIATLAACRWRNATEGAQLMPLPLYLRAPATGPQSKATCR
ncbi:MAG: tRNA (adenosine(37)-N6)-threonylcarbamoyltransferase complex dimerization subunit type 1 TsaB [Rhodospirillales bacterium]|nr:tRNA (adenosine(37)-N6)-threonylcarbamoyltransferase complex dimerization subunit type 1 TsaB [Rhodospirillales bacterium]